MPSLSFSADIAGDNPRRAKARVLVSAASNVECPDHMVDLDDRQAQQEIRTVDQIVSNMSPSDIQCCTAKH
jgi:hypothetical protein